jgi:hypothetical protein
LVPTISVSKVSLPSFQEWRICRCQRRRETVANTSASVQEHTTQSLEYDTCDQNDSIATAVTDNVTAVIIRRNSSRVENWWV